MTRYTVVWHPAAQNELAQIWLNAKDRDEISRASHRIDTSLRTDPDTQGTPVEGPLRQLVVPPLYVVFGANELDRLVKVVSVGRCD